jgi:hypothetical protein
MSSSFTLFRGRITAVIRHFAGHKQTSPWPRQSGPRNEAAESSHPQQWRAIPEDAVRSCREAAVIGGFGLSINKRPGLASPECQRARKVACGRGKTDHPRSMSGFGVDGYSRSTPPETPTFKHLNRSDIARVRKTLPRRYDDPHRV